MANAQNQVDLERALTSHNCIKRSPDLPLFYSYERKDTISGCPLVEHLERAAEITTRDETRKI
jgi:hypothetical protein